MMAASSRLSRTFYKNFWRGVKAPLSHPAVTVSSVFPRITNTNTLPHIRHFSAAPESKGEATEYEFQAETRMLLDIVAKSLYSEKEVFVRELISNASDAIEKFRLLQLSDSGLQDLGIDRVHSINISTDKALRTLTIQDSGVGMSKQEMIDNLGTIARSGSKSFMQQMKESGNVEAKDIIGQFGVGFYSAFMVADKIEVYSKSSVDGSPGHVWISDGSGKYSLAESSDAEAGTKIVLHLKSSEAEFSDENHVKDIIKKYSNFVGSDVNLNNTKVNQLKPTWLMDPKEVDEETHADFYRYVANAFDKPRFTLHYRADAPMDIRALFYVPESRPGMFETSREAEAGVALYCRKVMIKSKADNLLPKWLRFVKGVVDSEDIPLNLSRELLQDSALIRKLRHVLTNRILRFLQERSNKERKSYMEFYKDYSFFLKEGIVTGTEQYEKEEISKLLRFECSSLPAGETISIPEYVSKMKAGQRDIYYLCAPSRQLAETSPYFESLKKQETEVLFCYEAYDELVLMQLQQFDKKSMTSVEKEMRAKGEEVIESEDSLKLTEQTDLTDWMKVTLGQKAAKVTTTSKLESHPCVVTVEEMAAARHFIKTQGSNFNEDQRYTILQPQFEMNPSHPLIKKLNELRTSNPSLAILVAEQMFANSMVSAGLVEDPRTMLKSMNELLEKALEKH